MTVLISADCTACGACLVTCPTSALTAGLGRPDVRDEACTDCLACIEVCPAGAVSGPVAAVPGPVAAVSGPVAAPAPPAGTPSLPQLCTFFPTLEPIVQITDDRSQSSRRGTEFVAASEWP